MYNKKEDIKSKNIPVLITAIAFSFPVVMHFMSDNGKGNNQQAMNMSKLNVKVQQIKNEYIEIKSSLEGRVSAFESAEIRPQISGIIKSKNFSDGEKVNAGDKLFKIDDKEYVADLNIAKAAVNYAKTDMDLARQTRDRYKNLVKNKAVSKQDYDDAEATFKKLEAIHNQKLADYELAKIKLDYTNVRSPISGYVDISKVTVGELVTANQSSPLTKVTNIDQVYIDMTQKYDDYLYYSTKPVVATMQAYRFVDVFANGKKVDGSGMLISKGKEVNKNTGNIELRAVFFPNENNQLLNNQYIKGEIFYGMDLKGIVIPQSIVSKSKNDIENKGIVKVVNKDGVVESKEVIIEKPIVHNNENKYLISSGLDFGDLVIVEGAFKTQNGQEVDYSIINKVSEDG